MNTHSGQDYKHSAIASMQLPVGVFKASWAQMCFLSLRRAACPAPCRWRIYHRFVSFSTAVRLHARHLFNMLVGTSTLIAAFNELVGDKKWKRQPRIIWKTCLWQDFCSMILPCFLHVSQHFIKVKCPVSICVKMNQSCWCFTASVYFSLKLQWWIVSI